MKKKVKIAWGIDPSDSLPEIEDNISTLFQRLSSFYDLDIDPIYVTTSTIFQFSEFEIPTPIDIYPSVLNSVEKYLEPFKNLNLSTPIVIENSSLRKSSDVNHFLNHINNHDYDFVLLAAHGRSGLKRFVLGSFTENYILKTRVPTFIVNGDLNRSLDLAKAFLPVEIAQDDLDFYKKIVSMENLSFLKKANLYHHICYKDYEPQSWQSQVFKIQKKNYIELVEQAKIECEKVFEVFSKNSRKGLKAEYLVSNDYDPLSEVIKSKMEDSESGLLILKLNKSMFEFYFFSSLTKEMIRTSPSPVLLVPL